MVIFRVSLESSLFILPLFLLPLLYLLGSVSPVLCPFIPHLLSIKIKNQQTNLEREKSMIGVTTENIIYGSFGDAQN